MRAMVWGFALLVLCTPVAANEATTPTGTSPEICEEDCRARLAWFASDAMRGRDTISPEAIVASDYIAKCWAEAGLLPKGTDGWFQPFVVAQPVLEKGNALSVQVGDEAPVSYAVEKDWNPFSLSPRKRASGPVVFCGYGIRAPQRKYDDYAGVDVKGKIVLIFRKNPGWREFRHAAFTRKLQVAHKQGAAAVLLCNNPDTTKGKEDRLGHWSAGLGPPAGSGPIPYAFVSQDVARKLIAPMNTALEDLEARLRKEGPQSAALQGVSATVQTAMSATKDENARNVIGFLPGRDPEVSDEVVVLGAHYDHVGLGLFGSTGGPAAAGKIHNGADDNGSGTVSILELAEWFAVPQNRPRRSLLFIAFTGEERGLLGSKHYVENPTIPLEDTVGMVNLDMVGRANKGRLQVGGVGTAKGLKDIVARANATHRLQCQWDPGGLAPTDSTSFFRKRIPVLFFFTMTHEDYHKPTDDVELINFADMTRICHLVRDTTHVIAEREERLVFTRPPTPPRPPRMGVQIAQEPNSFGVPLAGVVANGPAAKAGIEAGDVIIALAGQATKDRQGLMQVLRKLKPGKPVGIQIRRGDETLTRKIVLNPPPARRNR